MAISAQEWKRQELRSTDRFNPFVWLGSVSETRYWAWYLIIPSLVVIAMIVLYPTLYGIVLSFREMRLTRPDLGTGFVGLEHYRDMLNDKIF